MDDISLDGFILSFYLLVMFACLLGMSLLVEKERDWYVLKKNIYYNTVLATFSLHQGKFAIPMHA